MIPLAGMAGRLPATADSRELGQRFSAPAQRLLLTHPSSNPAGGQIGSDIPLWLVLLALSGTSFVIT
ncbi:hypothetical protein CQ018_19260 [Arthrobacter sp. MYb227]|nr:hypothetical protein CQ018_19260 [Arthrobacter sp. MYb227]